MNGIKRSRALLAATFALLVAGCATTNDAQVADAAAAKEERCTAVTGSSICRKPGTGNTSSVVTVSGEDIRRSGNGTITGSRADPIKD